MSGGKTSEENLFKFLRHLGLYEEAGKNKRQRPDTDTSSDSAVEDQVIELYDGDVRKFVRPTREFVVSCHEEEQDLQTADSLSCLSFEQTIPSKFMMGTNQGNVISCRLSPKQGTNSQLLAAWNKVSSSVF